MNTYKILQGNSEDVLATMPEKKFHCCVTSPPYYGLRSYLPNGHPDKDKEIGLEETPDKYIARMVIVFRGVRRVLRDDGTLWINIGDSFSDKQLLGIPWRLAFALRADGWYLRSEIIWAKGVSGQDSLKKRVYEAAIGNGVGEEKARAIANAVDQYNGSSMPESVTDRPSKSHEQLFLFTKSPRYFYDATAIADASATDEKRPAGVVRDRVYDYDSKQKAMGRSRGGSETPASSTRNRRSVWTINPEPTKQAHFATMPTALIEPCIMAGCPAGGTVLDPFAGSGTTLRVAIGLGRDAIGIELNPEYVEMANKLTGNTQPALFAL